VLDESNAFWYTLAGSRGGEDILYPSKETAIRLAVLAVLAIVLLGCSHRPLLSDVIIQPDTISPNADGTDDVAQIRYRISRNSSLTMYFVDETGARHYYREDVRRSPGPRTAYFGGALDGSLLPDGQYTCVLEATDPKGRTENVEKALTIRGGDPLHIEIEGMSVYPDGFTPNRDGVSDRVTVAYRLNKEASWVDVYVLGDDGTRYPIPEDEIREMGAPGNHEHDYDAGVDRAAKPPEDGTYTVVVEAEDFVGNRDVATDTLIIDMGGVPYVEIVKRAAQWSSDLLVLGDTLTFTCTVKNYGTVPVRTKGPESGFAYTSTQNYNTEGYHKESGTFRVGLDYEGAASAGRRYPWRWQLGLDEELTEIDGYTYLMPNQTATVVGRLQIVDEPVRTEPIFWIGLIHEDVWIVEDYVDTHRISVEY